MMGWFDGSPTTSCAVVGTANVGLAACQIIRSGRHRLFLVHLWSAAIQKKQQMKQSKAKTNKSAVARPLEERLNRPHEIQ